MLTRFAVRNPAPSVLALAAAITAASSAHAEELIVNGGFENTAGSFVNGPGGYMTLPIGSQVIPGWTITHDQIAWISSANIFGLVPAQGSFLLDLTGDHDNASFAGVTQTIATIPSHEYTLTLSVGAHQGVTAYAGKKQVEVIVDGAATTFTLTPAGAGNQWVAFSLDFTATGTSTQITIHGTSSGTGHQYLGLDHVSVVPAAVPCPGDLNGSKTVDGDDLGTLLGQWGACAGCPADFNDDGTVDGNDLGTLLGTWGPCS